MLLLTPGLRGFGKGSYTTKPAWEPVPPADHIEPPPKQGQNNSQDDGIPEQPQTEINWDDEPLEQPPSEVHANDEPLEQPPSEVHPETGDAESEVPEPHDPVANQDPQTGIEPEDKYITDIPISSYTLLENPPTPLPAANITWNINSWPAKREQLPD